MAMIGTLTWPGPPLEILTLSMTTLHELDVPAVHAGHRDQLAGLSTLEAELLRHVPDSQDPPHQARLHIHAAIERATGVSLTRSATCTGTLAAPIHLDLAHLAGPIQTPTVAAQVRTLEVLHPDEDLLALTQAIREAAFRCIELKQAHGRAHPISSLKAWCHEVRPKYFALWCIRVDDDELFSHARAQLNSLYGYCNAVGVLFYRGRVDTDGQGFEKRAAPELSLGFALRELALELLAATDPQASVPRGPPNPEL